MHSADVRAHLSVVAEMLRHAIERIGEPFPYRSAALSSLDADEIVGQRGAIPAMRVEGIRRLRS